MPIKQVDLLYANTSYLKCIHILSDVTYFAGGRFKSAMTFCNSIERRASNTVYRTHEDFTMKSCSLCSLRHQRENNSISTTNIIHLDDIDEFSAAYRYAIYAKSLPLYSEQPAHTSRYAGTFPIALEMMLHESLARSNVGELKLIIKRNIDTGYLEIDFQGDLLRDIKLLRNGVPIENQC